MFEWTFYGRRRAEARRNTRHVRTKSLLLLSLALVVVMIL